MGKKVVLVIGAGSTYADCPTSVGVARKPPLDHSFFKYSEPQNLSAVRKLRRFVKNFYHVDLMAPASDRLEAIMAMLYADIFHPDFGDDVFEHFRDLVRLYNRRIARTTNSLKPSNKSLLFRMLLPYLRNSSEIDDVTFVTFNQDIHIERTLSRYVTYGKYKKLGQLLDFPGCYRVNCSDFTSPTTGSVTKFEHIDPSNGGPRILKLHGSLNWFSVHNSRNVSRKSLFRSDRKMRITSRSELSSSLTITGKRRQYMFPIVVPPVLNKASILHNLLKPIWSEAETALSEADEVVFYGYSCPESDIESANMIRRGVQRHANVSLIDPNPAVLTRYMDLLDVGHLSYYKNGEFFVSSR